MIDKGDFGDFGDFGELPTATRESLASFKKCNNAKHGVWAGTESPNSPKSPAWITYNAE